MSADRRARLAPRRKRGARHRCCCEVEEEFEEETIMATRSEQYRAQSQRTGRGGKRKAQQNQAGGRRRKRTRAKLHTRAKATYALEPTSGKRPSRKSTRKSANRAKPDTNFNLREEMQKGSPEQRARRARAVASRARGGG
jgi:hypothetical protein